MASTPSPESAPVIPNEEFTPREYQSQLYEEAIKANTIINLKTGTGKTMIAMMVIVNKSDPLYISFEEGGKRTVIAVPTKSLANQHYVTFKDQIGNFTQLRAQVYSGDDNIDEWKEKTWHEQFRQFQVLIMPGDIFRSLITHSILPLDRVNLIIFDECHHADPKTNHSYTLIMDEVKRIPVKSRPHILGLTPCLINKGLKSEDVEEEIKALEATLMSTVVGSPDIETLKKYGATPDVEYVLYQPDIHPNDVISKNLIEHYQERLDYLLQRDSQAKGLHKKYRACLSNLWKTAETMGIWAVHKLSVTFSSDIKTYLATHSLSDIATSCILEGYKSEIDYHIDKLENRMASESNGVMSRRLILFASPKMQTLLRYLSRYSPSSEEDSGTSREPLCGIVFVKEKKDVYLIASWLQLLSKVHSHFNFLSVNYVVGQTATASTLKFNQSDQKDALAGFREKKFNLIVATSILEEGIDVPRCNLVIRYDFPFTYREYIQSKGRARLKGGRFIVFIPSQDPDLSKQMKLLHENIQTEKKFDDYQEKILEDDEEQTLDLGYLTELKRKYSYVTDAGAHLTCHTAISTIDRYSCTLPTDSICRLACQVKIRSVVAPADQSMDGVLYVCDLSLPINSALRNRVITGDPGRTKKIAKKLAAFKACVQLHTMQELDDNLLPVGKENSQILLNKLGLEAYGDEYEESKREPRKAGTSRRRSQYVKLTAHALSGPVPRPKANCFLYVFHMRLSKPISQAINTRNIQIYDPAISHYSFAILTENKLNEICDFIIFTRSGEVTVTVKQNPFQVSLTCDQLNRIASFHENIFHSVLEVDPSPLKFDPKRSATNYFVVPVELDSRRECAQIDFDVMYKVANHNSRSGHDEDTFTFDGRLYEDAVVRRKYLNKDYFYVVKCDYTRTPLSPFPDQIGKTFKSYFEEKYSLAITDLDQPLIDVDNVSRHLNLLTSRFVNDAGDRQKGESGKLRNKVTLVPELCCIHPLPASYYRLTFMLPSILYKMNAIFLAEQLRSTIARETSIGPVTFAKWSTLDASVTSDIDCEDIDITHASSDSSLDEVRESLLVSPQSIPHQQVDYNHPEICALKEKVTQNLERDLSVSISAIVSPHYEPSIYEDKSKKDKRQRDNETTVASDAVAGFGELLPRAKRVQLETTVCPYKFDYYKRSLDSDELGPSPNEIVRALTMTKAKEGINLERLEMIGDSYLKYAVSLYSFCKADCHEGHLSDLRSHQTSNYNLFRLGKRKNIPAFMIASTFEPKCNWLPPGFYVQDTTDEASVQSEGFTEQTIPDKSIADCVEALIGAYLMYAGQRGALYFMRWLGLKVISEEDEARCNGDVNDPIWHHLPPVVSPICATIRENQEPALIDNLVAQEADKLYHIAQLDTFERDVLKYTFEEKAYLIQAFTHNSFFENRLTDCYQRLEFLGDAVIDYLVTRMIYADERQFSPGVLTDLRSALVNNAFFASLAVEYQFHRFIKHTSSDLFKAMNAFVELSQAKQATPVDGCNLRNLYRENAGIIAHCETDVTLGDVEVPKALGDIFESVAGAIFLDSGMSLDAVWRVYYPMMKPEIEHFTENIPKSPIRELFEIKSGKVTFLKPEVLPVGRYRISVHLKDEEKMFTVERKTKKAAKCAAAKEALEWVKSNRK